MDLALRPLGTTTSPVTRAEWLYQVHGAHGEDPIEGHWSRQYPWPAVSSEPRIQQLFDDLVAGGYHPFHAPCGVLLDEKRRPASRCIRCTWCDGYPCLVHAKSDAEVIAVRPALDHDNVSILVNAEVVKLETDSRGRTVTGVVVSRGGAQRRMRPMSLRSVGASNSARSALLGQRPDQRAWLTVRIRSGEPMYHNSKAGGPSKGANDTVFQKRSLNDFFGISDYDQPIGQITLQVECRGDEGRGTKAHEAGAALAVARPPGTPSTWH